MTGGGDRFQVVEFSVGEERFAIPVDSVLEIVSVTADGPPTSVDDATDRFVAVAPLLGVPRSAGATGSRGIVMGGTDPRLILIVDAVQGISTIPESSVSPAPERFSQRTSAVVRGLATDQSGTTVLLHPAALIGLAAGL